MTSRSIIRHLILLLVIATLSTVGTAATTTTLRHSSSVHQHGHTSRTVTAVRTTHALTHPSTSRARSQTTHVLSIHTVHTSRTLTAHTPSTRTTSTVAASTGCVYPAPATGPCIADPVRAIDAANHRTTVVGATLGVILGLALVAALASAFVLWQKLREAKRVVREQSSVLWKASGRFPPRSFEKPVRPSRD